MLDKDIFVKYIKQIMKQYDAIDELYNDFTRLFGSFDGIICIRRNSNISTWNI